MKEEIKYLVELNEQQYSKLLNCIMDGMIYNQEKRSNTKNDLMREKYNFTYEEYFKIYSIIRNCKNEKNHL